MSALQLETAAALLGPLLDEVAFVGGATVHLWITEPGAPPTRATEDVKGELAELQAERHFDYAVEGAMASYGPVGPDRASLVRKRIDRLVSE